MKDDRVERERKKEPFLLLLLMLILQLFGLLGLYNLRWIERSIGIDLGLKRISLAPSLVLVCFMGVTQNVIRAYNGVVGWLAFCF